MGGQSVWTGCGVDRISCVCELLLTNRTRCPTEILSSVGLTPVSLIVIVGVTLTADGVTGELSPPQAIIKEMVIDAARL